MAGGCFWGVEELFRHQPEVISTAVDYTGGDVKNATYRDGVNKVIGLTEKNLAASLLLDELR